MCSTSSMDETILFLRLIFVLVNTYRFQIPFLFSFKEKMKSDMKLCLPPCLLKLVWNNPLEHPVLENVKKLSFSFPVFSSLLFPENLINVLSWNSWNENENENENSRLKTPKENSFSETTPSRPFWDQCSMWFVWFCWNYGVSNTELTNHLHWSSFKKQPQVLGVLGTVLRIGLK